jgi:hypothetical protein
VNLYRPGHSKRTTPIASLVGLAFIGPKPTGLQINHKDGNKTNNRSDNLEYCTAQENRLHAVRVLKVRCHQLPAPPRGEKNHLAKLTQAQADAIRHEYKRGVIGYRTVAKRYGVDFNTIKRIIDGQTYQRT